MFEQSEEIDNLRMCEFRNSLPEETQEIKSLKQKIKYYQMTVSSNEIKSRLMNEKLKKLQKDQREKQIENEKAAEIKNKNLEKYINNLEILSHKYADITKQLYHCIYKLQNAKLKYKTIEYFPKNINQSSWDIISIILNATTNESFENLHS